MKEKKTTEIPEDPKQEKLDKQKIIQVFHDMDLEEIRCSLPCFPRNVAQKFATKKVYMLAYCLISMILGAYFTYTVSIISTIEKRFKLTSKHTGVLLAGNDVSQIILSVIISYYGSYGNRPKWIGIGVLAAACSSLVSTLPHLIYGIGEEAQLIIDSMTNTSSIPGKPPTSSKIADFCMDPLQENCEGSHQGALLGAVFIFFFAQMFTGVAVSIFYSIGFVYLDDNVKKGDSPIYYATSLITRTIGPVTGYILGSAVLKFYINPKYSPNLSMRDPRWLGAWWLGYLVVAICLSFGGILILTFPKTLPSTFYKKVKASFSLENGGKDRLVDVTDLRYYIELANKKTKHSKPSLEKLPAAIKRILTNKVYLGYASNTILYLFALLGYWNFKPKYLEFQFQTSASTANRYTGIVSLLASVLGIGISGIVLKKIKPSPRWISGYAIVLTLVSGASMLALMMVRCPAIDVQGPTSWSSDLGSCNTDCGCTDRYAPVCGEDGKTIYHSPCYAGCTTVDETAKPVQYGNCACVKKIDLVDEITYNTTTEDFSTNDGVSIPYEPLGGTATQGYCPSECNSFYKYLLITVISKMFDASGRVGGSLLFLRCLQPEDKGLGLGLLTTMMSLFAFIPAPIVMGAIVDSTCLIWDNKCGERGNCWLYDSEQFRVMVHLVPAIFIFLSVIGDIIVFRNCDKLSLYEENELTEKKEDKSEENASELKSLKSSSNGNKDSPTEKN